MSRVQGWEMNSLFRCGTSKETPYILVPHLSQPRL